MDSPCLSPSPSRFTLKWLLLCTLFSNNSIIQFSYIKYPILLAMVLIPTYIHMFVSEHVGLHTTNALDSAPRISTRTPTFRYFSFYWLTYMYMYMYLCHPIRLP